MKKLIPIFLLITAVFFVGTCRDASAKTKSHMAEAGLFGGAIVLDNSTGIDDRNLAGIDLTLHHTAELGLNVTFINQLSNFDEIPSFNFYTVSGVYKFAPKFQLSPYLLLGMGAGTMIPDPYTNRINFVFTLGGGVKYFIMKRIALKTEIRDYITVNGMDNNLSATLGVVYVFDLLDPLGDYNVESAEPWQTTIDKEKEGPAESNEEDEVIDEQSVEISEEASPEPDDTSGKFEEPIEEDIEELSVEPIENGPADEQIDQTEEVPFSEESIETMPDTDTPAESIETTPDSDTPEESPKPSPDDVTPENTPDESGFRYIER